MDALQSKLEELLKTGLENGQADLETLPNGHVCGHVISKEFKGVSYDERRQRIREILDKKLNPAEIANVSTLLTYTPEEWSYEPKES